MAKKKVIVIGGGVAGMSAAHELAERGFDVEIYESQLTEVGGKARSVDVPDSANPITGKSLPGEHGFRFFPGFYKHVTDTMKRIPYRKANGSLQKNGCYANLVPTTQIMLARYGQKPLVTIANFPKSISDIKALFAFYKEYVNSGLTANERRFFEQQVLRLMFSCNERMRDEYEKMSWWEYVEADRFSPTYQTLLAGGLVHTLVAAQPTLASTKTGGNAFLQIIYNILRPGTPTDRVLNGPTNDRWFKPWLDYLLQLGVKYNHGLGVHKIEMNDGLVQAVYVTTDDGPGAGTEIKVSADYYIMAVPVEGAAAIIANSPGMTDVAPELKNIAPLADSVAWMTGIQYYLNTEVDISKGHVIYSDSDWAVTSITQNQFWTGFDLGQCYNGKIKCIISVDVSDWFTGTFNGKLAKDCTPQEVVDYTWDQLEKSLNVNGQVILKPEMREFYYFDYDISDGKISNNEPLLVNTIHSWTLRPEAHTNIPNLFLAADYVRTYTDLACMEAANEAARRAVNCIIDDTGGKTHYCKTWPLTSPALLNPLKWYDAKRYVKGLPNTLHYPWYIMAVMLVWGPVYGVYYVLRAIGALIFG